jgi:GR25 family glycosyltransferase involved in LPS biosynthesis
VERKKNIAETFGNYGMDVIFVEDFQFGVDLHKNDSKLNNAEFSLMKKHLKILQTVVEQNIEHAFIIEDDLFVDDGFDLTWFFDKIVEQKSDYDIVFFGSSDNMHVTNQIEGQVIYHIKAQSRCAHGYFITKKCCETLLSDVHFEKPYDHYLNEVMENKKLLCGWTYPHLRQMTEMGMIKSTLR